MIESLRATYGRLPDQVKAALATALFTFLTTFGASLIGWVQSLVDWAQLNGDGPAPDPSLLKSALFSAAAAAGIGFVNFVIRFVQAKTSLLPGTGPRYHSTN